jgi:hypothetical protein
MYILYKKHCTTEFVEELLGMPATGKSTFVQNLSKDKNRIKDVNDGLPKLNLYRQFFKFRCIILLFFYSPTSFFKDLLIIISSRQKSLKDLLLVLSNWYLVVFLYKKHSKNITTGTLCLFDQGIFQALWSISFSATKEYEIFKLVENKILPSRVYFLDANDSILIERALNRNVSIRLDYNNKDHIKQGRKALIQVKDSMIKLGYVPLEKNIY